MNKNFDAMVSCYSSILEYTPNNWKFDARILTMSSSLSFILQFPWSLLSQFHSQFFCESLTWHPLCGRTGGKHFDGKTDWIISEIAHSGHSSQGAKKVGHECFIIRLNSNFTKPSLKINWRFVRGSKQVPIFNSSVCSLNVYSARYVGQTIRTWIKQFFIQ